MLPRFVVPAAFVVSGAAGLMLQVAWFRLLAQTLGGTLAAATADLSAFMLGLAAGSFVVGRWARRIRRPLAAYAFLEVGAGVAALASLPYLRGLDHVYHALAGPLGDSPTLLLAIKFVLAAAGLVPATFFMGGTLPVLCQALARRPDTAGISTGRLYSLNTWGAVLGTLVATFHVLPSWGLSSTVVLAAALDLVVAVVVLAVVSPARRARPVATAEPSRPVELRLAMALLFVVGFTGMAYELLWTRILAFYFGSGVHAFALVLAVVLAGLAIGAYLGGWLADRTGQPWLVFAGSQALLAITVVVQVLRFPALPDFLYEIAVRTDGLSFGELQATLALGAAQLLLPSALCMGAALPAMVRAHVREEDTAGSIVGHLVAANTLGTIPGAIVAAWVLIPLVQTQGALFVAAGANLILAGVAVAQAGLVQRRIFAFGGWATVVVASVGLMLWTPPQHVFSGSGALGATPEEQRLVRLDETAHGAVSLTESAGRTGWWRSLSIDGVNVAGTSPSLLSCQSLQGHLPLLLHGNARRVLHVGFGSGGTAAAVAAHETVEVLEVAEINPAILRVSREEFPEINRDVLSDPRVQVRLVDGRNHLIGTRERYDCILSDSIHPRYRGNANLYTVEYFQLCRDRLAPGGLVSTWLPIYSLSPDSLRSIVASMRHVFPHASVWYLNSTINEFVVVVGRMEGPEIDLAAMERVMSEPRVAASLERVGLTSVEHVLDFFVAQGSDLDELVGDVPLHHDDHPWVELESATVVDREGSWFVNLRMVVQARHSVRELLPEGSVKQSMSRFEDATRWALDGQLARLAGQPQWRESFERAWSINPDDREPWDFGGYPPWVRDFVDAPRQQEKER